MAQEGVTAIIPFTIGSRQQYTDFILRLRREIITARPVPAVDILREQQDRGAYPVLREQNGMTCGWLWIRLQVEGREETTTLAIRDDNVYCKGFRNQNGTWYELSDQRSVLPQGWGHRELLQCSVNYSSILRVNNRAQVRQLLWNWLAGRNFAESAMRSLSSYRVAAPPERGPHSMAMNIRMALAGLIVMVCESARFNPFLYAFVGGWDRGTTLTSGLLDYIWTWKDISHGLRQWRMHNHPLPYQNQQIGTALSPIHLVLNISEAIVAARSNPSQQLYAIPSRPNPSQQPYVIPSRRNPRQVGRNTQSSVPTQVQLGRGASMEDENAPDSASQHQPEEDVNASGSDQPGPGEGDDTSSQDQHTQPPEPEDDDPQGPDQPGEDDGSRGFGDTSESADDSIQVCGRPQVEIFKATANFRVTDMSHLTMAVFDGIRAQIIYMQKEQEEDQKKKSLDLSQKKSLDLSQTEAFEQMKDELVLTGPNRGISAYGNFGIQVDMPGVTGGEWEPSSSGASIGAGRSITWEWDGYNPDYAAEVDAPEPVTRPISLSTWRKIDVSYLVMSNAVEATVVVKLRLQDDLEKPEDLPNEEGGDGGIAVAATAMEDDGGGNKYTAHGIITAQIEGFDQYPIVLFRKAEEEKEPMPSGSFIIPLARSVVQVPAGKRLRIGLGDLHITESSSNREVKKPDCDTLSFDIGHLGPTPQVNNDSEVELNVTWRPQQNTVEKEPAHKVDLTYAIEDKDSFTSFVKDLRRELARQPDGNEDEDVLDGYSGPDLTETGRHPVLNGPHAKDALLWIHIKLPVVQGEETSSTTLAVRGDKCYGVGFMNQSGIWYDLGNRRGDMALPSEYNSVLLDWGVSYKDILGVSDWDDVVNKLQRATLGKAFAERAVRTLSSYPFVNEGESTRLALAGLLFMLCESAKFNRLHKLFADGWESGMVSSPSRVKEMDYSRNWGSISRALLHWKDLGFDRDIWCHDLGLQSIGISGPKDALDVLHLVFNNRDAPLNQGKMKVSFSKIEERLPPPSISGNEFSGWTLAAPAMEHPPATDKRSTLVYVGGIGNCEGKEVECKDEIKKLYTTHVDPGAGDDVETLVTIHETNKGMAYALVHCRNADLALKAIKELNKKHILGKLISVSFFYAQRDTTITYTIGETEEYRTKLINHLRNKLREKIMMHIECEDTGGQAQVKKPVLPEQQGGKQPERWIDIKLMVKEGDIITSTTTLVIRDDNLYVKGFRNKNGKWFELVDPKETEEEKLPAEDSDKDYMAELVGWGLTYSSIMGLKDDEQVKRTLKTARLGRAFAERAVRRLSCYPDNEYNDDMPVRLGLAGLIVMICEAARMDAFFDHFADQGGAWDRGVRLEEKLFDYMWNWKNMSAALLKRKYNPYRPWDTNCGVECAQKAFDCVHLVLNSTKIEGSDRAQVVEILDVSVNFRVVDIKFIDEAQLPCNIYTQPEMWRDRQVVEAVDW